MYVNAFLNKNDSITVIERIDGNRVIKDVPIDYSFYIKDRFGSYESIFKEQIRKVTPANKKDFYMMKKQHEDKPQYEADINRVYKYLSENYEEDDLPELKIAFFDIEVGWNQKNNFSDSTNAENPIISYAITDKDTEITKFFCIPPETITYEEAVEIVDSVTEHGTVFENETDLIYAILESLEPYDVISGWNSEAYDIKYIINRIFNIADPEWANKLCLCGEAPVKKTIYNDKFKRDEEVYHLVGKIHLDYMLLYKKYTYIELSSYKLDNVAYIELDDKKVEYNGTLDTLYKKDFKKFVEYNIQDTFLLHKLDSKLKFIDTTNIRAHQNGVVMQAAMGTVGIVEQAIINEGHKYYNKYFPNKVRLDEDATGAAGAFVMDPKAGIRRMVAGNDINSLYPSTIRTLNMSPETLFAQILTHETDAAILDALRTNKAKTTAEAWHPFFHTIEYKKVMDKTDDILELEINETKEIIRTEAKNIHELIFGSDNYCVSANGTVFTRNKKGIIPHLLERWYSERQEMQAKAEEWYVKQENATDPEDIKQAKYWYTYWDQRQLAKKIDLNALYGALLNSHCRFYDKRIGQSTTLTGRSITCHMGSKINEIITGEYDLYGSAIIYGDTDSVEPMTNIPLGKSQETIEKLFANSVSDDSDILYTGNSELVFPKNLFVSNYDGYIVNQEEVDYIYRHKVTDKDRWEIEDELGNIVRVTGSHSLMVERNGTLYRVKPSEIQEDDLLISLE